MNILKNKVASTILAGTTLAFVMSVAPDLYAVHHDHEIDHHRHRKNENRKKIKVDKTIIKKAHKKGDRKTEKQYKIKKDTHEKRLKKHDKKVHELKNKHNEGNASKLGRLAKKFIGL